MIFNHLMSGGEAASIYTQAHTIDEITSQAIEIKTNSPVRRRWYGDEEMFVNFDTKVFLGTRNHYPEHPRYTINLSEASNLPCLAYEPNLLNFLRMHHDAHNNNKNRGVNREIRDEFNAGLQHYRNLMIKNCMNILMQCEKIGAGRKISVGATSKSLAQTILDASTFITVLNCVREALKTSKYKFVPIIDSAYFPIEMRNYLNDSPHAFKFMDLQRHILGLCSENSNANKVLSRICSLLIYNVDINVTMPTVLVIAFAFMYMFPSAVSAHSTHIYKTFKEMQTIDGGFADMLASNIFELTTALSSVGLPSADSMFRLVSSLVEDESSLLEKIYAGYNQQDRSSEFNIPPIPPYRTRQSLKDLHVVPVIPTSSASSREHVRRYREGLQVLGRRNNTDNMTVATLPTQPASFENTTNANSLEDVASSQIATRNWSTKL